MSDQTKILYNAAPIDHQKIEATMQLSQAKKKQLRTIGHSLKPVVTVSDRGVTEGVSAELERALEDHELIKVKLSINAPEARKAVAEALCTEHQAQLVQLIGKTVLLLRRAKKPNPKLSNLLRWQGE